MLADYTGFVNYLTTPLCSSEHIRTNTRPPKQTEVWDEEASQAATTHVRRTPDAAFLSNLAITHSVISGVGPILELL